MSQRKKANKKRPETVWRPGRRAGVLAGGCLLLILAVGAGGNALATETPGQATAGAEGASRQEILSELFGADRAFSYQRENRFDPFMPFIREKTVEQKISAEAEEIPMEELTGLRKFEPGQLNLVAIVFGERGAVAMVQDSVGQGYPIRKGDRIGRSGVVEEIAPNKVVVQQTIGNQNIEDAGGERKTLYRRVEMVLRKEGGE